MTCSSLFRLADLPALLPALLLPVALLLAPRLPAHASEPSRAAPAAPMGWRTTVSPAPGAAARSEIPPWSPPTVRLTTGSLPPTARPSAPALSGRDHMMSGIASYYWQEQKTASGEHFDRHSMTAAHRTLPFNTRVKVTHVDSGRSVVVRINDRGPFKTGRVIDLSYAAAGQLGIRDKGLARVRLDVLK